MRKFLVLSILICVIFGLGIHAHAATEASSVSIYATVSNDGSAQVTLTANIHLDQTQENMQFALPKEAGNITVNGSRARGRVENGLRQVDISGIVGKATGDFALTFTYSLPDLIVTNPVGQLELQMPLLSGFTYPVRALELSVTLPGSITAKPAFSSGYHQANIEKDIYCTTSGATITAVSQVEMKDHETLSMSLLVSEEMFPQPRIIAPDFKTVNTFTLIFWAAALIYWAIFLRNLPSLPAIKPTPPEGYNAGELSSALCLQGGNLNMMVFSWAQLGYLQIHLQPNGKVFLYRQMDMGNERSAYEQRCFKQLFLRQSRVDTGTLRYGELYRSIEKLKPNLSPLMHQKTGNSRVFQYLTAACGALGGITVAIGLSTGAALQWILIIVLGFFALFSSLRIQQWAVNLFVPDRRPLWVSFGLCGGWLALSALAGQFPTGLGMVAGQLFAGLLSALGGRRTPSGRQVMGDILGLRRYFKKVSQEQLWQICRNNPEYFHQLMPYAMALGADSAFAKRFGKLPIGPCPYIFTGTDATMRATQWQGLMRRVLQGMNTQTQHDWKDKLFERIAIFRK